ncbi:uroporphyrinogen-III synthase [Tabrizicola sp. BL-A-41-H6]|uniref:uroporphyrinogen-III synthase n=1 Tax=Tabrizicola sp. BL-A-41-H6 TaxID=3421107 RepID=UPI003D664883
MAKQSQQSAAPSSIPVLLTRPLDQSLRFGAALEERFGAAVRLILSPLMRLAFVPCEIPQRDYQAVVFTSEAAVDATRQLAQDRLPKMALCVGARTAVAASAAGFAATSANGDVEALQRLVMTMRIRGPLLYLHGRETRGDLAKWLISEGIETVSMTVYDQIAQPLSTDAEALLRHPGPVIVPIFSPRSAALLTAALPADRQATVAIAALSGAVAAKARDISTRLLRVAATPDADAMLDALELLLIDLRGS